MSKRGKFIVLEGLDGAGTTTQAFLLCKYLFEKHKANVPVLTREPTSLTPYGLEIRRRLKHELLPNETVIDDFKYWADLFVNDRKWHLSEIIESNLHKGLTIISDRHMLSTLAYQSAQGGQMEYLVSLHAGLTAPDLTLFLRVPVDVSLHRIMANRCGTPEFFEKKEFLEKTAQNYVHAINLVGQQQKVAIIDGTLPIEEVHQQIRIEVDKLYK